MYKKILVPIDLTDTDHGKETLAIAERLLTDGGEIIALNVVEEVPGYVAAELPGTVFDDTLLRARKELEDAVVGAEVNVLAEIKRGSPASAIVATAEQENVDLVIIASHRPGLADYFLGSTAARVVRHAKCPVLVDR
ncbi:MAG: universal stress protein [Hyphomicrobiales bacterium]